MTDIDSYIDDLEADTDRQIARRLRESIDSTLDDAESKVWHGHPVWFLDGNPIVGFSRIKRGMRVLFWSGQSFATPGLTAQGKFKAAEALFETEEDLDAAALVAWLNESQDVQWDYKNIVRRKGRLEPLKGLPTS